MRYLVLAPLVLLGSACSGAITEDSRDLTGSYDATVLMVGTEEFEHDVLALGGIVSLRLEKTRTFEAVIDLPAPWAPFHNDTSGYHLRITGTYEQNGGEITLHSPAGPSWVATTLIAYEEGLRGTFETDPAHGIQIRVVLAEP